VPPPELPPALPRGLLLPDGPTNAGPEPGTTNAGPEP